MAIHAVRSWAEYRRALAEYQEAQAAYAAEAEAYWTLISQKRRERTAKRASQESLSLEDYVLTQPPVYNGPPKPVDPSDLFAVLKNRFGGVEIDPSKAREPN